MIKHISRGQVLLLVSDMLSVMLSFAVGLLLRFEGEVPASNWDSYLISIAPIAGAYAVSFALFRLYRQLWSYASIYELLSVVKAVTLSTALVWLANSLLELFTYPRSVIIISWLLLLALVGGSRFLLRFYQQHKRRLENHPARGSGLLLSEDQGRDSTDLQDEKRVLIVGAGDAGCMVLEELRKHANLRLRVVGFVDDDLKKVGRELHGVNVLGLSTDLERIAEEEDVDQIIIAIPSATGREIRRLISHCERTRAEVKILPGFYEIVGGNVSINQIREVKVEDLLRREPAEMDTETIAAYIQDRTVLVTGGGGSIGSELCRQIIRFKPRMIIIYDISEYNIYRLQQEFKNRFPAGRLRFVIGDIKNQNRLDEVFSTCHPQVVFHAAAYKHVPLMEHNATEAVGNNVFGTREVALAAHRFEVERFVLISTDKAVNPTNVMGATKRVAEKIIVSLNRTSSTRFVAVRFGNVLGSRGSVIPLFKEQIRNGGPVEVTHREITRYFMTIPEASQLVLQAAALGSGGEVFVLDMGEPVKIIDLARDLIRLSGLEPNRDIDIRIIGLREGEKLYEEPLTSVQETDKTSHDKIFVARLRPVRQDELEDRLVELTNAVHDADPQRAIRSVLMELVEGYEPQIPKEPSAGGQQEAREELAATDADG